MRRMVTTALIGIMTMAMQTAAPAAERAITVQALGEFRLDLVGNLAAMAASLMQHIRAPVLNEAMAVKVRKQS